jgi:hypothetical protein
MAATNERGHAAGELLTYPNSTPRINSAALEVSSNSTGGLRDSVEQARRRKAEPMRDLEDRVEARVAAPAFDPSDLSLVQACGPS